MINQYQYTEKGPFHRIFERYNDSIVAAVGDKEIIYTTQERKDVLDVNSFGLKEIKINQNRFHLKGSLSSVERKDTNFFVIMM